MAAGPSGFGLGVRGGSSQFANDKFLKKIGDSGCTYTDQRVFKSESHSITILGA